MERHPEWLEEACLTLPRPSRLACCPACDRPVDFDDHPELVTRHGSDGPLPVECPCGQRFMVTEQVKRKYTVVAV